MSTSIDDRSVNLLLKENVKKLYLAGPTLGIPHFNRDDFVAGAEQLRFAGYEVLSPMENLPMRQNWLIDSSLTGSTSGMTKDQLHAIGRNTEDVLASEGVALLDGWMNSTIPEVALAERLGLPVFELSLWLELATKPQLGRIEDRSSDMVAPGSREDRIQQYKMLADDSDNDGDSVLAAEYLQQIADLRDVLDLAAIVRQLCSKLPQDNDTRKKALQFLQSHGLASPLREV